VHRANFFFILLVRRTNFFEAPPIAGPPPRGGGGKGRGKTGPQEFMLKRPFFCVVNSREGSPVFVFIWDKKKFACSSDSDSDFFSLVFSLLTVFFAAFFPYFLCVVGGLFFPYFWDEVGALFLFFQNP